MEEFDLIETSKQESGTKGPADHAKVLDSMKSQLSTEQDPAKRDKILNATLDSVMDMAETDRKDLLDHIKDLTEYQDSVGLKFEGFTALNDEEERVVEKAKAALDKAEVNLTESKIVPTSWFKKLVWNVTGGESKVDKAQAAVNSSKTALEDARLKAQQMFQKRIESADMEELLTQYANKSRATCDQLKEREQEISQTEEGLKVAKEEASKNHAKALEKKKEVSVELKIVEAQLKQEQEKLGNIVNKQSEEYANQLHSTTELEQKLQELKGKEATFASIAASKESFVNKHNLTLKVLTTIRTNLQTQRGKLQSDTKERIDYYQGYTTALKARTDQEFAAILEKLGIKTDEVIATTLGAMLTASEKTRQSVMEGIPEHEKAMSETYISVAESMASLRAKDADIRKNFDEKYGIDISKYFEQYHTEGSQPTGGDNNPAPKKTNDPVSDDLLG